MCAVTQNKEVLFHTLGLSRHRVEAEAAAIHSQLNVIKSLHILNLVRPLKKTLLIASFSLFFSFFLAIYKKKKKKKNNVSPKSICADC